MSNDGQNGWRTDPLYTYEEAAHLAHVSPQTVKNWLFGYTSKYGDVSPLFDHPAKDVAMVSFLQFIEIVVAAKFRKAEKISFKTVRRAYDNAKKEWELEYPFAHLKLEALGGHIVRSFHEVYPEDSFQTLDTPEQWTLPSLVIDTIHQFDYVPDLVARWYPIGKNVPIIVDPRFNTGFPTILGRGVTVGVIHKRFKLGQRIDYLAEDFALDRNIVEEAVRYAETVSV